MSIMKIPVTKGKSAVDINTDDLPEDVYAEALAQGLKVLLNRGMSKITSKDIPDEDTRKHEAMLVAEKNLEALMKGEFRRTASKGDAKVPGVVMTEAKRIARNLVKDAMKRKGIKVSYVEASEITKAAVALIESDPNIIVSAEANLRERAAVDVSIDVT